MLPALHSGGCGPGRAAGALRRIPSLQRHDGLLHARATAASGSRTALDLAATEGFAEAVVALDHVRKHVTSERLLAVLDEWAPIRGRRGIEAAIGA